MTKKEKSCFFESRACPICKKPFIPAPLHAYKVNTKNGVKLVCSWHCVMEDERRKEQRKRDRVYKR